MTMIEMNRPVQRAPYKIRTLLLHVGLYQKYTSMILNLIDFTNNVHHTVTVALGDVCCHLELI